MTKVKDLPSSDRSRTQIAGGTLEGRPVFLYCTFCGERRSATRGDYFMWSPDQVMTCCDEPMILAHEQILIVEVK